MAQSIGEEWPFVSVILPVRNEVRTISRCLDAVLMQDYTRDRIEIIVVDGMSDDGTREIISGFASRQSRLLMMDNPAKIVPTALNCGIQRARGEVIIRVDGHTVIAQDYVRRCIEDLMRIDADCVGGAIQTIGTTRFAQGIALAQSSPFGVGNAAFRFAKREQYVDTLAFGAYKRQIFDRVGLFDEELVRNQDDEFNFRVIRAGGKIWMDPNIRSTYYSRSTLRELWKQYLEYGLWKIKVIKKHRRPASWRHLVPALFVLALFLSIALSMITGSWVWAAGIAGPYVLASLSASLCHLVRKEWKYTAVLPLAFATMHVAYGIGFLFGIVHFVLLSAPNLSEKKIKDSEG